VVWVDPGPTLGTEQAGRRPYVVISHGVFNQNSQTVIGLAITSKEPKLGFPLAWELSSGGLPRKSWVKPWQIRTISFLRIGRRLGRVDEAEVDKVVEGLMEIVGG